MPATEFCSAPDRLSLSWGVDLLLAASFQPRQCPTVAHQDTEWILPRRLGWWKLSLPWDPAAWAAAPPPGPASTPGHYHSALGTFCPGWGSALAHGCTPCPGLCPVLPSRPRPPHVCSTGSISYVPANVPALGTPPQCWRSLSLPSDSLPPCSLLGTPCSSGQRAFRRTHQMVSLTSPPHWLPSVTRVVKLSLSSCLWP